MSANREPSQIASGPGSKTDDGFPRVAVANDTVGPCPDLDCACLLARRAARSVTQLYDVVLAPTRIKATQFVLLRAIAAAGQIAQWQLGKQLSIAVETLTRRLGTMRRMGWVELRSGSDKREHLYNVTELGQQQLERAMPYWRRAEDRLREQLGEQVWKKTQDFLDRLAVAAELSLSARMKNLPVEEDSAFS
jgi:DNA-binding MarR family transcriptional regulator